jgi:hypothetical protein
VAFGVRKNRRDKISAFSLVSVVSVPFRRRRGGSRGSIEGVWLRIRTYFFSLYKLTSTTEASYNTER